MKREMLRAKIHRITVTERNVAYEGSLTLDRDLMDAADMLPYERIEVYDVDNGNRFATYLIEGARGSGDCCVNGAAAHPRTQADPRHLHGGGGCGSEESPAARGAHRGVEPPARDLRFGARPRRAPELSRR
jgi:aspartate 1-decarboxylase